MTLQCMQVIPTNSQQLYAVWFLCAPPAFLSMTEWGPEKRGIIPSIFVSALWWRGSSTVLQQSSAKHHRAEVSPSWYWTYGIHYTSMLPTEAESALNYGRFMVILPEESNLKQVQHHQEMTPVTCSFKGISASRWKYSLAETITHSSGYFFLYCWLLGVAFPLVTFRTSNILLKIPTIPTFCSKTSRSLLKWMNSRDEMPAFPSITTEIIHSISKAAACKSCSIAGTPMGIQCLWKSRKGKNNRLQRSWRGYWWMK